MPVPKFLASLLDTELAGGKDGDGLVFPSRRGGYLTESELRWVFDPAATAIGVDGLTPHELRHTCASLAIAPLVPTSRCYRPSSDTRRQRSRWTATGTYSPTTSAGSRTRSTPRLKMLRTGPGLRAVASDGDRQ